jgi:hypothetical protein
MRAVFFFSPTIIGFQDEGGLLLFPHHHRVHGEGGRFTKCLSKTVNGGDLKIIACFCPAPAIMM